MVTHSGGIPHARFGRSAATHRRRQAAADRPIATYTACCHARLPPPQALL